MRTVRAGQPPKYKVYTATMTQESTDNPVVNVLENNIGPIVWTRQGTGTIVGTLAGAFETQKTTVLIGPLLDTDTFHEAFPIINNLDLNEIRFINWSANVNQPQDNAMFNTTIEIRVYK